MTLAIRDSLPSLHWVCVETGYEHPQISANKISEKLINPHCVLIVLLSFLFFQCCHVNFQAGIPCTEGTGSGPAEVRELRPGDEVQLGFQAMNGLETIEKLGISLRQSGI